MITERLIFNGNSDFSKSVTLTVEAETIKQITKIPNLGVKTRTRRQHATTHK